MATKRQINHSGWEIVTYQGKTEFKRVRIRNLASIQAVARHVRNFNYVTVLGPHYSEKTRLLEDVAAPLQGAGFKPVYVNLWQARSDNETVFFTSLEELVRKSLSSKLHPTESTSGQLSATSPRSFQNFLEQCRRDQPEHLALLIDHLHALPPDLTHSLLLALRAVHMEQSLQSGPRLVAVITGGVSLADLSHGPTSPFNIAKSVVIESLDDVQSSELAKQTLLAYDQPYTADALDEIVKHAGGDRFLIPRLCYLSNQLVHGYRTTRVTKKVVQQAAQRLLEGDDMQLPMREALQLIEEDLDTLDDVLEILQREALPQNQAKQPPSGSGVNRLQLCGAVRLVDRKYQIKNLLYDAMLRKHFTPALVANVLRGNGRFQQAIDYLAEQTADDALDPVRTNLLEAIVQSIYAARTPVEAFVALAGGMRRAFNLVDICVYRADVVRRELQQVYPTPNGVAPHMTISLEDRAREEVQAFLADSYALRDQAEDRRLISPLTPERRPIGVVTVERYCKRQERTESPPQLQELRRFLRQAAGAVENVTLRYGLQEIGQAVLNAGAADGLQRVLQIVSAAVGGDLAALYRLDANAQELTLTAQVGRAWARQQSWRSQFGLNSDHPAAQVAQQVAASTMPSNVVHHSRVDYHFLPEAVCVFVPLIVTGDCLGVLVVGFEQIRTTRIMRFRPEADSANVAAFADYVATAVYNIDLLRSTNDALQRHVKELNELQGITRTLISTLDTNAVLSRIITTLKDLFPGCEATLWRYDSAAGEFSVLATSLKHRESRQMLPDENNLAWLAVQNDELLMVEKITNRVNPTTQEAVGDLELRSLLLAPLIHQRARVGVIALYVPSLRQFTESQQELLRSIAAQAAIAIENARQFAELTIAQEKLQQLREQELFNVSQLLLHRLGNAAGDVPHHLGIIRQLLADHGLPDRSLKHIEQRVESLRHLLPAFRTVVNLNRAQIKRLDLRHVVESVLQILRPVYNCRFDVCLPPVPVWIGGDHVLLTDAVQSVVDNGCEVTSPTGTVGIMLAVEGHGWALLQIIDQGVGIPVPVQERMFELGYTTKENPLGSKGRGLFTSRLILEKYGGDLKLLKTGPQGSSFQLSLPLLHDPLRVG